MQVEFIPLIELATFKVKDLESIEDHTLKRKKLIERNYQEVCEIESFNNTFYKLEDLSRRDLYRAIDLHVRDMDIENSCALFGGYGLGCNQEIVLYPQCCGLLSEIQDWNKILDIDFQAFYLSECHPSPYIEKIKDKVHIHCHSEHEDFIPSTEKLIIIEYKETRNAVERLNEKLGLISKEIDEMGKERGVERLSKIMIWGGG